MASPAQKHSKEPEEIEDEEAEEEEAGPSSGDLWELDSYLEECDREDAIRPPDYFAPWI